MRNYLKQSTLALIKMEIVKEGTIKIFAAEEKKISKQLEIFYNPVMKFNRDVSIIVLNALDRIEKKEKIIGLPLAGSGIRGLRFLKELKKHILKEIHINDYKNNFKEMMLKNLELNKIKKTNKVIIHNTEANLFMLHSKGFDYIDVDPFGTPNPFLDFAARRIARGGILAVTATDTSALSGTYPSATKRKYFAEPMRNQFMHEIGVRILIRKIQMIAAQYDKALIPVFSYSKDHYYRIFFRCEKGRTKADKILKQHKYFILCNKCLDFNVSNHNNHQCRKCKKDLLFAGPLWIGELFDKNLVNMMKKEDYAPVIGKENNEEIKFFENLLEESKLDIIGFYDIHNFVSKHKIKTMPRLDELIKRLNKYGVVRTHFSKCGIKCNISAKELVKVMKKF